MYNLTPNLLKHHKTPKSEGILTGTNLTNLKSTFRLFENNPMHGHGHHLFETYPTSLSQKYQISPKHFSWVWQLILRKTNTGSKMKINGLIKLHFITDKRMKCINSIG